jgi:hypothetical protein
LWYSVISALVRSSASPYPKAPHERGAAVL